MKDEELNGFAARLSLSPHPSSLQSGQTPDLPATHVAVATVAPFPAWRGSQGERCAEPEV